MKIKLFIAFAILGFVNASAQIFFKVENNSGTAPSYIFGSHHMSPITIVEESGAMEYFKDAGQVVGELDLTGDPIALATALQPFMMAPSDSTLSVLLAGEDIEALNAQFQKWAPMPGMSLQMLDGLKPMAVSTMMAAALSQQVMPGFDPTQQLDTYFMTTGAKEGKKILGLETPEYQGEVLFNMMPLSVQADALVEMLKNPEETLENTKKLAKAYQSRDLEGMLALSKEDDEHPEFMEYILYRRNGEWMKKLPEIINEMPSFIVVGALHLAGPQGIIEGLKNKGFKITPIY